MLRDFFENGLHNIIHVIVLENCLQDFDWVLDAKVALVFALLHARLYAATASVIRALQV